MRAAVCARYGPPEEVRVAEVDTPSPGEDELLVEEHAGYLTIPEQASVATMSARMPFEQAAPGTDGGRFEPVIDRGYPLERIVDACRYVETGQKVGNVVITVDSNESRDGRPAAEDRDR